MVDYGVYMNKQEAQKRAKRIFAFRDELADLQEEGVIQLLDADTHSISTYHDKLLYDFSHKFDADLTNVTQQLSWGMRIASTLGAIALSLAVFLFFELYWTTYSTLLQVSLLSIAPFIGWGLCEVVAAKFKTTHYTSLAALVAIACFVADLYIVGQIYNITPSPNAFLAWGLFGLFLSYRHDLPIVLGISLISLINFVGGFLTNLSGFAWPDTGIPEFYLVASLLCLGLPLVKKPNIVGRYRYIYYFVGLLTVFCTLEWVLISPRESFLPESGAGVEWTYTIFAFLASGLGVIQCIRTQWAVGTYLSATAFVLFMLHKYADWFWEDLPHYVFFLILGLITIVVISLLRRLRMTLREEA